MSNHNLTIQGKTPNPSVAEYLLPYDSAKELENRIVALCKPDGNAYIMLRGGFYSRFEEGDGTQVLLDCLQGLLAGHEIVEEILRQTEIILSEIPMMLAAELYQRTGPHSRFSIHTPIYNALEIADVISPVVIFDKVQKASYHILQEHLSHPKELPFDAPVTSAIRGMMGYIATKPQELSDFAHFLEENKTGGAYLPTLYALLGDTRAVSVFIEALTEERAHMDFKFVGRRIRRILTEEHRVPLQFFEEQAATIQDDKVLQKFRKYCQLEG